MREHYGMLLPEDLPETLLQAARDLHPQHIGGFAWPYPEVLDVIDELSSRDLVTLGGDVFRVTAEGPEMTYDSWYLDRRLEQSWAGFVAQAAHEARRYVEAYYHRNGRDYLYSPTFTTELHWYLRRHNRP